MFTIENLMWVVAILVAIIAILVAILLARTPARLITVAYITWNQKKNNKLVKRHQEEKESLVNEKTELVAEKAKLVAENTELKAQISKFESKHFNIEREIKTKLYARLRLVPFGTASKVSELVCYSCLIIHDKPLHDCRTVIESQHGAGKVFTCSNPTCNVWQKLDK